MSVRVMAWVWAQSTAAPTQRLVLLAIADCANDHGADAYPSTATLAAKTGLSERGVRKAVTDLEAIGELSVAYKTGPRGTNRYRVHMRDLAPDSGSRSDPAPHAGNPEQDAGYETRNDVPGNPAPRARNLAPRSADPARGAPEPSENHPPTEPSENHPSGTRKRARREPKPIPDRPDVEQICTHLVDKIVENGSKRPTITETWRTEARLLLDKDGRTLDQVLRAIDWCQADPFWRANIKSLPKLRQQYDTLRLHAQRPNGRASPTVEVNGLRLKPSNVEHLDREARMAALDAMHERQAIEGGSP